MKHLIFLLSIVLSGCHVHYHIDQAKEIRVKTTTDNYKPDGCGVIGCCVLHGGTTYPSIPLGYDIDPGFYAPTPYLYPTLDIKAGNSIEIQRDTIKGTITFISDYIQHDSVVIGYRPGMVSGPQNVFIGHPAVYPYTPGKITNISNSEQYDSINPNIRSVHAATELTKKQKDFFKNLKPNQ